MQHNITIQELIHVIHCNEKFITNMVIADSNIKDWKLKERKKYSNFIELYYELEDTIFDCSIEINTKLQVSTTDLNTKSWKTLEDHLKRFYNIKSILNEKQSLM